MRLPHCLSTRLIILSRAGWKEPQPVVLSLLSPPELHNKRIPVFFPSSALSASRPPLRVTSLLCHALHTFVSLFSSLSPSPCSNQCLWWIIHSEQWGLKLFDWQLYSPVCYIINIPLLGIVAMVRAITGQRRVSSLMESPPSNRTLFISFSFYPSILVSMCPFFPSLVLVCPPEGHYLLVAHGAEQMSFRWPFDVSSVSLKAILMDTEVYICSAFIGQSGHI